MKPISNFAPLIIIALCILTFTLIKQLLYGWDLLQGMYDFMGAFFIVFGSFKILNLNNFAHAYAQYDLIAQVSTPYAYAYPFIELALGILYLSRTYLTLAHWVTLIIMSVGAGGVLKALLQNNFVQCACLGLVFNMPMTYVTLVEDLLMAGMALFMLVW
jgi:hypothetical protein